MPNLCPGISKGLVTPLTIIMHECCDSYSAPDFTEEGAYLIDELSIYDAISLRNIIKLAIVAGYLLSMTSNIIQPSPNL